MVLAVLSTRLAASVLAANGRPARVVDILAEQRALIYEQKLKE
jgi:hypothetical protein